MITASVDSTHRLGVFAAETFSPCPTQVRDLHTGLLLRGRHMQRLPGAVDNCRHFRRCHPHGVCADVRLDRWGHDTHVGDTGIVNHRKWCETLYQKRLRATLIQNVAQDGAAECRNPAADTATVASFNVRHSESVASALGEPASHGVPPKIQGRKKTPHCHIRKPTVHQSFYEPRVSCYHNVIA